MPFEIPSDLHPDLMPVAFLLGHWNGNGHGDYPTIDAFEFGQEVAFTHDARPFLHYFSRTWLVDEEGNEVRPLALETGFLRPQPDGEIEVVLTHATGVAE
ncbi:MAG: FABP family protein, partial [Nocardioidaceae bacterium]